MAKLLITSMLFFMNSTLVLASTDEPTPMVDKRSLAALVLKPPIFGFLDCEHDGTIEKGEVDEHFAQVFSIHDRDRSKQISKKEYMRAQVSKHNLLQEHIFALIDSNADNKISAREYRLHLYEMIEEADIDSDGEVSLKEISLINQQNKLESTTMKSTVSITP